MRASLGVSTRIEHIPNPFDADAIRQAAQQAFRRGLVTRRELADVEAALGGVGGLAA